MLEIPADRPELARVLAALAEHLSDAVLAAEFDKGELTLSVRPGSLLDVLGFLKDAQGFGSLTDLIVLDNLALVPQGRKRWSLLYQLFRFADSVRIRLSLDLDESEAAVSVTPLFLSADWAEREAYDMFGLVFQGHPGLSRIYLEDDFEGFPLRKDFPLAGRTRGL